MSQKDTNSKTKYWVRNVKTVSTFPQEGTFNQDAESIARIMGSPQVSPQGIGSGIRMIQYFINRAGDGLSAERRTELEKAKHILQRRLKERKGSATEKRHTHHKESSHA